MRQQRLQFLAPSFAGSSESVEPCRIFEGQLYFVDLDLTGSQNLLAFADQVIERFDTKRLGRLSCGRLSCGPMSIALRMRYDRRGIRPDCRPMPLAHAYAVTP
jgi:hypothetical protein